MAENKRVARGKKFREAFAEAQVSFQRTYHELSAWLQEMRLKAKSVVQLGVETFALGKLLFTAFTGPAGIVIFFADGSVWYAATPAIPCAL